MAFTFLMTSIILAQQANTYFPSNLGYVWNYKVTPLDSLNNPLTQLEYFRKDSFGLNSSYQGRSASFVFSKEGPWQTINIQVYSDTNFYSFEGTNGFEYFSTAGIEPFLLQLDSLGLDPNFNFVSFFRSLQNWYSVYRFAANQGSIYTLLQRDTTISTFRIRFRYAATRNADQTLTTPIGTFTCKKFTTQWDFSYLLGPISLPLFSIEDTVWIAPGNWMVKAFQPSKSVDLSLLGIPPFQIQGRTIDILSQIVKVESTDYTTLDFKLNQNYPNPFGSNSVTNSSTTRISWNSPISGITTLKVYDVLGNEVTTLVNEFRQAGNHEVELNLSSIPNLSSGVYFYKIQVGELSLVRKMIFIR